MKKELSINDQPDYLTFSKKSYHYSVIKVIFNAFYELLVKESSIMKNVLLLIQGILAGIFNVSNLLEPLNRKGNDRLKVRDLKNILHVVELPCPSLLFSAWRISSIFRKYPFGYIGSII